jgi:UDP-2-acetamido-3-amino-2,3-dideoxy-glucuronate N-acetyltransferase
VKRSSQPGVPDPTASWFQQTESQRAVDAHFDGHAPFWQEVYEHPDVSSALFQQRQTLALEWIQELGLAAGARVLDAGCGAGFAAIALAQRGFTVDAIDPAPAMVDLTLTNAAVAGLNGKLTVRLGDVHALDAEPATYDLVLGLGLVPWLHSPARAAREVARVLKPGGWFVSTCANRHSLTAALEPMHNPALDRLRQAVSAALRRLGLRHTPPHGLRPRMQTRAQFDALLADAGFRKVRTKTYGFGPFSFLNRQLPERLSRGLDRRLQAMADVGTPGIRAGGIGYMVLSRKEEVDVAPKIHPTAEVSPAAVVGAGSRIWNEAQIREGARVGRDCILAKGVYIDSGVVVGDRVKLENRVSVFQGARLADGVFIGPHSCLLNDKLPRAITPDGGLKLRRDWQARGVTVEEGASIGGGCTVLPGIRIGRFAMVGAGAVVTRDIPDFGLAFGNPARLIGYACECGARLEADGGCPSCGRHHAVPRGGQDA